MTITPTNNELGLWDAADLLGVPLEPLVRVLESGELPFHWAATERLTYLQDLLAYKEELNRQRREALGQMARAEVEAGSYDVFVLPDREP